jgi:zinc transport system permease protein
MIIVTAITIVLLSQVVGVVLVIALLSMPAATVSRFTNRLSTMMVAAALMSLLAIVGGLIVSYEPELPAGATIIQIAGVCYIAVLVLGGIIRRRPAAR